MPSTMKEKNIVTTCLETKSFKTVSAKFCRKFNLNNYPQKSQLSLGTEISSHRVSKQPQQDAKNSRSGRKLTARCLKNVDALRDSVRSLKKSIQRHSQEGLSCVITKNLEDRSSAGPILDPDQA